MERTLILIKPDTVQRSLAGRIISRFEDKGYKITAMKFMWMTREIAEEHYAPHKGKGFYEPLVKYMTSGPIIAMVVEGYKVIEGARIMMGLTDPLKADPGTIRADFALKVDYNLVHGADSEESAQREIPIFFKENEIISYEKINEKWI